MMNEEVINAGIKGFKSSLEESYKLISYMMPVPTRKAIEQAVIWAVTQYIMNTTDQFKGFVVSSSQTQSPKCEVSGKQNKWKSKPIVFYKGHWYYSYDELVGVDCDDLIRPVISEYHAKQLYRSV